MVKHIAMAIALAAAAGVARPSLAHDDDKDMGDMHHDMIMLPPEGGDHAKHFFDILDEHVKLTDEQKAKVKAVMTEYQPKLDERWKKMRELNRDVKEIMHQESEKIREFLSPEQREKFDDMKEHMHGHRGHMPMPESKPRSKPGKIEDEPNELDEVQPDEHRHEGEMRPKKHQMPDDMPPPEMYQQQPQENEDKH